MRSPAEINKENQALKNFFASFNSEQERDAEEVKVVSQFLASSAEDGFSNLGDLNAVFLSATDSCLAGLKKLGLEIKSVREIADFIWSKFNFAPDDVLYQDSWLALANAIKVLAARPNYMNWPHHFVWTMDDTIVASGDETLPNNKMQITKEQFAAYENLKQIEFSFSAALELSKFAGRHPDEIATILKVAKVDVNGLVNAGITLIEDMIGGREKD